ncbi:uncharacterized protein LOC117187430 isoform X1 [Drosophila miranda]|uniref:uncharacterized protein LOC117187430 isoform X1 n=2 Tax=Drosophila miranda TaxID=7229 RepID=UPI00143F869B|nr:uncharacterized protein LOC117187430 isoform X1 [Drosophila miranda]
MKFFNLQQLYLNSAEFSLQILFAIFTVKIKCFVFQKLNLFHRKKKMSENSFNSKYLDDDDEDDAIAASEGKVSSQVAKRIWQPTIDDTTPGVWEPPALAVSGTASDFIHEVMRSLYGDNSKDPENGSAQYFKAAENYALFGANYMGLEEDKNKKPPPGFDQSSSQIAAGSAGVSGQSYSGGPSSSGMGGMAMSQQPQHKAANQPGPAALLPQQQQHPRHPSPATVPRVIAEAAALAGAGAGIDMACTPMDICPVPRKWPSDTFTRSSWA